MPRPIKNVFQLLLPLLPFLALCGNLPAKSPDSWFEVLLQKAVTIENSLPPDPFQPFISPVLQGDDSGLNIDLSLNGADEIFLFTMGVPDNRWGACDWGEAVLMGPDGTRTPLKDWPDLDFFRGRYSIDINLHSGLYEPLRIAGRELDHGVHVMADSGIRVPTRGKAESLNATIGLDDWTGGNGSVQFLVTGPRAAAFINAFYEVSDQFTTHSAQVEMQRERLDHIWLPPVGKFSLETLAERYLEAVSSADFGREPSIPDNAQPEHRLSLARTAYHRVHRQKEALDALRGFDAAALRMAIEDLSESFPEQYRNGREWLIELEEAGQRAERFLEEIDAHPESLPEAPEILGSLELLRREALLANPLLDFEKLLVLRRVPVGNPRRNHWLDRGLGEFLGLPKQSSWGNSTIPRVKNWDNQISTLQLAQPDDPLEPLFEPSEGRLINDIDLNWDGARMLFSMPDESGHWQIHELEVQSKAFRQLTPDTFDGIHHYDACYLPNDNIAFISTAPLQGVPCNASVVVGMMYLMDGEGKNIRQVCFEQDHDYYPSVLNNGRILYLRWDYTDTPHVWNRILMSMNPDGTNQMEYYGSNSYWPNAVFYARAIPGDTTKIAGIVTGHHEGRIGDLVLFDPARGRAETSGVIQRIPGRGETVEPLIEDKLTEHNWPKFLHPFPLSDKYFLVSAKPHPDALWGIYLVDTFDNMVLIREEEGHALLEPIPLRAAPRPPVIPDKTRPDQDDSSIYMVDVYRGPGLAGVPRGTVKKLRLFSYHFGFQTLAGIDHRVGSDGPWEVKRVLGTVPVEEDGSAYFQVPAKTPISVQPLDEHGQAIALMRSWMTAQPGEFLSCVGCHENQSGAPPDLRTKAFLRGPSQIEPWYGPERGFSFQREVQPVLDRYCVECHNGDPESHAPMDLRPDQGRFYVYEHGNPEGRFVEAEAADSLIDQFAGIFPPAYIFLRKFVRTGGLESDLHMLPPMEFHAETSELIQILRKGHHGVELPEEGWDRLVTWIDLNAPCHGTWGEIRSIPGDQRQRRIDLREAWGGLPMDGEKIESGIVKLDGAGADLKPGNTEIAWAPEAEPPALDGWPLSQEEARNLQKQSTINITRSIDLGDGVSMQLNFIPAGVYTRRNSDDIENGLETIRIEQPFWMGACEVTNQQFQRFDPDHDSRFEHRSSWIFSEAYLGWPFDEPDQPVVRVSLLEAQAFCDWLSDRIQEPVQIPSETEWEYACLAGRDAPFHFGGANADFTPFANMGDESLKRIAEEGWRPRALDLIPKAEGFNDHHLVTAPVGSFQPNAWGLHDMHGNAAEWTRSDWQQRTGKVVVKGGSWRDRPRRCMATAGIPYQTYQKVFNVGFRVVIPAGKSVTLASQPN